MFVQLNEMNGKMIGHKPLYLAVAQRKEERKALLQVMLTSFISLYNLNLSWIELWIN